MVNDSKERNVIGRSIIYGHKTQNKIGQNNSSSTQDLNDIYNDNFNLFRKNDQENTENCAIPFSKDTTNKDKYFYDQNLYQQFLTKRGLFPIKRKIKCHNN